MLVAKFFSSSRQWRSRSSLVTKLLAKDAAAFTRERWIRPKLSPVTIWVNNHFASPLTALKIILIYVSTLQLNPYPNTQLDLQCSANLSFQCTAPSTWLTNWCMDPSTWLTHQLEKNVGCKVLQFIKTMKIKKLLGYKTLGAQTQQLLQEKDEIRQNCLRSQFVCNNNCNNLCIKWDCP